MSAFYLQCKHIAYIACTQAFTDHWCQSSTLLRFSGISFIFQCNGCAYLQNVSIRVAQRFLIYYKIIVHSYLVTPNTIGL